MAEVNHIVAFKDVAQASWLDQLNNKELSTLCRMGEFLTVKPGQQVIRQGDEQPYLYLVLSGDLDVSFEVEGEISRINTMGEGETFGEMAMFDDEPASATVEAKTYCYLWRMKHTTLFENWSEHPRIVTMVMIALFTSASRRLKEFNPKLVNLMQSNKENIEKTKARKKRLEIARRMMAIDEEEVEPSEE